MHDAPHVIWVWKIREYEGKYYGVGYLETENPRLMQSVDAIPVSYTHLDVYKRQCL